MDRGREPWLPLKEAELRRQIREAKRLYAEKLAEATGAECVSFSGYQQLRIPVLTPYEQMTGWRKP